jgi:hypothetical protein
MGSQNIKTGSKKRRDENKERRNKKREKVGGSVYLVLVDDMMSTLISAASTIPPTCYTWTKRMRKSKLESIKDLLVDKNLVFSDQFSDICVHARNHSPSL